MRQKETGLRNQKPASVNSNIQPRIKFLRCFMWVAYKILGSVVKKRDRFEKVQCHSLCPRTIQKLHFQATKNPWTVPLTLCSFFIQLINCILLLDFPEMLKLLGNSLYKVHTAYKKTEEISKPTAWCFQPLSVPCDLCPRRSR